MTMDSVRWLLGEWRYWLAQGRNAVVTSEANSGPLEIRARRPQSTRGQCRRPLFGTRPPGHRPDMRRRQGAPRLDRQTRQLHMDGAGEHELGASLEVSLWTALQLDRAPNWRTTQVTPEVLRSQGQYGGRNRRRSDHSGIDGFPLERSNEPEHGVETIASFLSAGGVGFPVEGSLNI